MIYLACQWLYAKENANLQLHGGVLMVNQFLSCKSLPLRFSVSRVAHLDVSGTGVFLSIALRRRYELRDIIDPILLNDIDESNEWLTGRLRESENDYVFDEEDGLTYNDVYEASGVREPLYRSRSQSRAVNANKRNSASATRQLILTRLRTRTFSMRMRGLNLRRIRVLIPILMKSGNMLARKMLMDTLKFYPHSTS